MGMMKSIKDMIQGANPFANNVVEPVKDITADSVVGSLIVEIDTSQQNAKSGVRAAIEKVWKDEYKVYIGKSWDMSFVGRSSTGKERNFNSQDNLILPTTENIVASLTSSTPTFEFDPMEPNDAEITSLISDFVPAIMEKNQFPKTWRQMIRQFVMHGPLIGIVDWDGSWIGGQGPNRWVGEIDIELGKKDEWFFDPAILDLEKRLQECSFINREFRMKISDIVERWEDTGSKVMEDSSFLLNRDEGADPKQATVIAHWHRGTPKIVTKEWKQRFNELADEAEQNQLPYAAQDYRDMAKGILKGVHVAYKAGSTLLEYIPYVFDDGEYPIVYRVLYVDEEQPTGMGEIRNLMVPQHLHNVADEIELGAMMKEGLGGFFFQKGSIDRTQQENIKAHNSKSGAMLEVNDINGMKERSGARIPASIVNYKEHKQRIIDTVSQNTAIQQGISPGANVPYATVEALGARADVRTKAKVEILEDFLKELSMKVVKRAGQFYTQKRMFRITGERQEAAKAQQVYGVMKQIAMMPAGTAPDLQMQAMVQLLTMIKTVEPKKTFEFGRADLMRSWARDTVNSDTGMVEQKEEFIPEFDIKVKVGDERPTDRNYYTNIAMSLLNKGMGIKAFWKTIDEGKFPPVDEILQELDQQMQAAQQAQAQQQMNQTQQGFNGQTNPSKIN